MISPDTKPAKAEASAVEVLRDLNATMLSCPMCLAHLASLEHHRPTCKFGTALQSSSSAEAGVIYEDIGLGSLPVTQSQFDGLNKQLDDLLLFINTLADRLDAPPEIHMAGGPGHAVFVDWIADQLSAAVRKQPDHTARAEGERT